MAVPKAVPKTKDAVDIRPLKEAFTQKPRLRKIRGPRRFDYRKRLYFSNPTLPTIPALGIATTDGAQYDGLAFKDITVKGRLYQEKFRITSADAAHRARTIDGVTPPAI